MAEQFPNYGGYVYTFNNPVNLIDPTGMAPEPPIKRLEYFRDDTGEYFWNFEKDLYEHYTYNDNGTTSFKGYYDASEFKEPVGDYSIIFDLSAQQSKDKYDTSKTIWSVASHILGYLNIVSKINDISDSEKYPGVKILSSKKMNGAITLGNLIITNTGMEADDVLDHEYGHYLDFKHHFNYNKTEYLKKIGVPSLRSAAGSRDHDTSETEKRANRLGGQWGNNQYLKNLKRNEK